MYGAGITSHEAKASLRRMNREIENRMIRRKARKRMNEAGWGLSIKNGATKRVEYQCFYLCGACGYFTDKTGNTCPSCGKHEWLDLGDVDAAENLRDLEEQERHTIPTWTKRLVLGIFCAIATVLAFLNGMRSDSAASTIGSIVVLLAAVPTLYYFSIKSLTVLLHRFNRRQPIRWRLPALPSKLKKKPTKVLTGRATGSGHLVSPFTGRPCLAYKILVLFDTPGDARPPEWVLSEINARNIELDGLTIPTDKILISSPAEPVSPETLQTTRLSLKRFLRERGLFLFDGEYKLFEARIESNEEVEASFYSKPEAVVIKAVA
ncbi:MAG: hypothetical protein GY854_03545 [Deltaproteobacteria bacterium]|nr:hypothetical protein [Deltaproteobacteria bacterium]